MAKIFDFEEEVQKRRQGNCVDAVIAQMSSTYRHAGNIVGEFEEVMRKDIRGAIKQLPRFLDRIRSDVNPGGRAIEALAGGPNHDWTIPLLNIVGTAYPNLDRDTRHEALKVCINFLDHLKYNYSQNHVELIDEPWLASDIITTRPLYNPGYEQHCKLLETHKTWKDCFEEIKKVRGVFWLALAVARTEYASLPVRHNFYGRFPTLMDRTQDAIATTAYFYAESQYVKNGISLEETYKEELINIDPALVPNIFRKIEERKWVVPVDYTQLYVLLSEYERQKTFDRTRLMRELHSVRKRFINGDEALKEYEKSCYDDTINAAIQEALRD